MPRHAHIVGLALVIVLTHPITSPRTVEAQKAEGPAVQAVVGFMNILDPDAVAEALATAQGDLPAMAEALLDELGTRGILSFESSAPVREALGHDVLARDAFVLYLADLLNGAEPLDEGDREAAEAQIAARYCGLTVPEGVADDARRVLVRVHVADVIRQFVDAFDCISPRLRDSYGRPVT